MSNPSKRNGFDDREGKQSKDKGRIAFPISDNRPSADKYRQSVQGLPQAFRNSSPYGSPVGNTYSTGLSTSPQNAISFAPPTVERLDATGYSTSSQSYSQHPGCVTHSGVDPETGVRTNYQVPNSTGHNSASGNSRSGNDRSGNSGSGSNGSGQGAGSGEDGNGRRQPKYISDSGSDRRRLSAMGYKQQRLDDPSVVGLVFEMLLVAPSSGTSTITTVTAQPEQGWAGDTRRRRYVIVQESRNGGPVIALPITTGFYNGAPRGAAAPELTRANLSIIYTGRTPPAPTREELPRPQPGGGTEAPMLPNAIRVVLFDPADTPLDQLARLDYGNGQAFDINNSIRRYGRVHRDSVAPLLYQYRNVVNRAPGRDQRQTARPPAAGPRRDEGSGASPPQASSSSAPTQSGAISAHDLNAWLAQLRSFAERNHYPPFQITQVERAALAGSAQVRNAFYNRLQQLWTQHREDEESASDSDTDNDEDSDSDREQGRRRDTGRSFDGRRRNDRRRAGKVDSPMLGLSPWSWAC